MQNSVALAGEGQTFDVAAQQALGGCRIVLPLGNLHEHPIGKREFGREVDRQTHEVLVDVLLPSIPAKVAIGQRADVWIALDKKDDVVRVPLAWVQREGTNTFCYVDRNGRIERAPIKLGIAGRDLVEVVEGLSPGDTVLTGTALTVGRRWRSVS